jgi:hypothetical protein
MAPFFGALVANQLSDWLHLTNEIGPIEKTEMLAPESQMMASSLFRGEV